ncbi:MAG: hypothetical protein SGI71_07840 [Verrucomicrobiota bacterium]|nr:hypothetical protein [Verrucomicrobiota bacterium]
MNIIDFQKLSFAYALGAIEGKDLEDFEQFLVDHESEASLILDETFDLVSQMAITVPLQVLPKDLLKRIESKLILVPNAPADAPGSLLKSPTPDGIKNPLPPPATIRPVAPTPEMKVEVSDPVPPPISPMPPAPAAPPKVPALPPIFIPPTVVGMNDKPDAKIDPAKPTVEPPKPVERVRVPLNQEAPPLIKVEPISVPNAPSPVNPPPLFGKADAPPVVKEPPKDSKPVPVPVPIEAKIPQLAVPPTIAQTSPTQPPLVVDKKPESKIPEVTPTKVVRSTPTPPLPVEKSSAAPVIPIESKLPAPATLPVPSKPNVPPAGPPSKEPEVPAAELKTPPKSDGKISPLTAMPPPVIGATKSVSPPVPPALKSEVLPTESKDVPVKKETKEHTSEKPVEVNPPKNLSSEQVDATVAKPPMGIPPAALVVKEPENKEKGADSSPISEVSKSDESKIKPSNAIDSTKNKDTEVIGIAAVDNQLEKTKEKDKDKEKEKTVPSTESPSSRIDPEQVRKNLRYRKADKVSSPSTSIDSRPSSGIWPALAVSAATLALMVGVAFWMFWGKYEEKKSEVRLLSKEKADIDGRYKIDVDKLSTYEKKSRDAQGTISSLEKEVSTLKSRVIDLETQNSTAAQELTKAQSQFEAFQSGDGIKVSYLSATATDSNAFGRFLWDNDGKNGHIFVKNMPKIEAAKVWHVWLNIGDQVISAGTFTTNEEGFGRTSLASPDTISTSQKVEITITPEPKGSTQPTAPPALSGF